MTEEDAKDFYEAYLAAWNAQDLTATCGFYTEPAFFVLPERNVVLEDENATYGFLEEVFERLNEDRYQRSSYRSLRVRNCGEGLSLLDVGGIHRVRRDGSSIETIDCHYVVRHDEDGGWRIAVATICAPATLGS